MKTKKSAIIFIIFLTVIFLSAPLIVIQKTFKLSGGYKGLSWNVTEDQTRDWINKNSNKAIWSKCDKNHYGVLCYKVYWKDNASQNFEYLEFQFKDGKLCSVLESYKETQTDPRKTYNLGSPQSGSDIEIFFTKEKGVKYKYVDRVFYYISEDFVNNTKNRYAISQLTKNIPDDLTYPDTIEKYQFTKGYYSREYVSFESEEKNFPTFRFKHK